MDNPVHLEPTDIQCHLEFDEQNRLHLDYYLFEVGDLLKPHS